MRRLIAILLLFVVSIAQAHTDSADDAWEIVERCIGEPTTPPIDWSYDGTIIMSGYAGLHGMNANWETPHILVFDRLYNSSYNTLSPDGTYLVLQEREVYGPAVNGFGTAAFVDVTQLVVHDTTNSSVATFDWEEIYELGGGRAIAFRQLRWLNNEEIIFEQGALDSRKQVVILNVITGEIRPYEYPIYPLWREPFFYASPNWATAIQSDRSYEFWNVVDVESGEEIYREDEVVVRRASWSANSEQVVFYKSFIANRFDASGELVLANSDFTEQELMLNISEHDNYITSLAWSQDGQYFSYFQDTLHIAHIEEKIIYDTCISDIHRDEVIWSPTAPILAYQTSGSGYRPMVIINFFENISYIVGVHYISSGNMLGWRAD